MSATVTTRQSVATWLTGGGLLLGSVVVGAAAGSGFVPWLGMVSSVLFSAALLVFAFGIRGAGSVTARRPLGTVALAGLAVWLLLGAALTDVLASRMADGSASTPLQVFAYVDAAVQFALAVIVVVQIYRAGVVPAPWNRVPGVCLAAVTLMWLLHQTLGFSRAFDPQVVTVVLLVLNTVVRVGSTILFGVLAVVFADRARRGPA